MRHWLLNFAILTLAYVKSCASAATRPAAEVPARIPIVYAERQSARALRIESKCSTGRGLGSGVIVGARAVMTARHVVECDGGVVESIAVIDSAGTRRSATLDRYALDNGDAARLEIEGTSDFDVPPVAGTVKPGDYHTICVATAVPRRSWTCGIVQSTSARKATTSWPADFGNSGSGVYDQNDRLVGILTRIVPCNWGGVCGSIVFTDIGGLFDQN